MDAAVPMVEVTDHGHTLGIGRPDGKVGAGHAAELHHMCAKLLVHFVMRAFIEEINVHLAEHGTEGISVLLSPCFPVAFHFKHVVERLLNSAQHGLKQTVRMDFSQREAASIVRRINDRDFHGIRRDSRPKSNV